MRHIVGIVDWDGYYTMTLMEYVNQEKDISFQIVAYSSWTQLLAQSENLMRPPDLLLVGEHIMVEDVSTPMMFITEDKSKKVEKEYIFKYDNLTDVIKKIEASLNTKAKKDDWFVSVFSPVGRCGKTTFSHGLCEGKKSLYVGFEDFFDVSKEDRECSEFMYYLTSRNSKILDVIDCLERVDNCMLMKAPATYGDSRMITNEHLGWLKTIVSEKTDIKQVVFDIGFGAINSLFSEDSQLLAFDKIYVPGLTDEYSRKKMDSFRRQVENTSIGLARKMEFIYME